MVLMPCCEMDVRVHRHEHPLKNITNLLYYLMH